MARKITLTVPDALYRKIDRWRSGFNLSRIFQEAVSDAIAKKEEFQKRMGEETPLADVIKRLKTEKALWEGKLEKQAEKAGALWASRARYEDLIRAVSGPDDQVLSLPQVQQQINESLNPPGEEFPVAEVDPETFRRRVQPSWLKGVRDFWDGVRDKL